MLINKIYISNFLIYDKHVKNVNVIHKTFEKTFPPESLSIGCFMSKPQIKFHTQFHSYGSQRFQCYIVLVVLGAYFCKKVPNCSWSVNPYFEACC